MQSLEIISVNLWQILVSLCNLLLLFLLLKRFLYKPVSAMLEKRRAEIDERYEEADKAEKDAQAMRAEWEEKTAGTRAYADELIRNAENTAGARAEAIVEESRREAERIVRKAREDAALERARSEEQIRRQIADVSTEISEKVLEREIKESDHRALIDSFLAKIGQNDDGNR